MMRSWVRVPVLSVHRTSIAPKFWIALSRLTITFSRDMAIAPLARFTVTIIGSISGVRPTATATANSSASSQSCFVRPLMRKTVGTMTRMNRIISQVNLLMPWSKAVGTCRPAISWASWPKNVLRPVRRITPVAVARHDVRTHEAEVRQVEGIVAVLVAGVGVLLGGHGLARQGGLIDEEVLGFEQAQVRRDHVACGKPHDIARHELLHRDLGERIVRVARGAPDARGGVDHGAQLGGGLVRPVFLDEGGRDREDHHGGDDDGGAHVPQKVGDGRQGQ